jgi:hypothetical protein
LCIAPTGFERRAGSRIHAWGLTRPRTTRLPDFALPSALRGKTLGVPRRGRMVSVLHTAGRWTWNSLAIAAVAHLLLIAMALLMQGRLEQSGVTILRADLERHAAALLPETAPELDELPALENLDEELLVTPDVAEHVQDAGDPDFIEPEPEFIFAPEPERAQPQPAPSSILPPRPADAGQGLGAGTPEPARSPGGAGLYRNRSGVARDAAVRRHGGGSETEGAVNLGLEYLARMQHRDGSWIPLDGFESAPRWMTAETQYRGGITALCALPFLAAGHSTIEGRYRDTVRAAVRWLLRQQSSDGAISYNAPGEMYTHTVATLALCEAYGMSGETDLRRACERAVRFLERSQGRGGGWDYRGRANTGRRAGPERNDLSITGWAVLALRSARSAGIEVSEECWRAMTDLYDRLSLETGETRYADAPYGNLPGSRRGIGMVGVGLTSRVILDADRFEKRNTAAQGLLLADLPEFDKLRLPSRSSLDPNFHSFYGWYYGTLGMFLLHRGEGAAWRAWNDALKGALVEQQVREGVRRGSWPAADSWLGPVMGDFYSTACAVLCLEVYYRYNPMHRPDSPARPVVRADKAPEPPDRSRPSERARELRQIARDTGHEALPALLRALGDESATVRSAALFELGRLRAAQASPRVTAMLREPANEGLRLTIVDTLGRLGDPGAAAVLIPLLGAGEQSLKDAARAALRRLSDGHDHGYNQAAWRNRFAGLS